MKRLILLLTLLALPALAANIEADVVAGVTQCGFYLDGASTPVLVTVSPAGSTKCRYSVASVSVGSHTITADARMPNPDPVWGGTLTSVKSVPFAFTKPAAPAGAVPTNLVLLP